MKNIETSRLLLRPFLPTDGDALYAYLSDPEVVRFEPYRPFTREAALKEAERRAHDPAFLAVCLKDGTLIGNLFLSDEGFSTYEIGYVFSRAYWHHGYAAEAAQALVAHLFRAQDAHRIIAMCDPRNPASWHLMERLGMRREAHQLQNCYFFKDESGAPIWHDSYQYALLQSEWKGTQGALPLDPA